MGDSWLETDAMSGPRGMKQTRIERDPLGELPVPADALWGVQTERARNNFPISNLRPLPAFVDEWIPAAVRRPRLAQLSPPVAALDRLSGALLAKGEAFDSIVKSGRTHLQDATPVRLGQEFTAYGHTVERNRDRLTRTADDLRDL